MNKYFRTRADKNGDISKPSAYGVQTPIKMFVLNHQLKAIVSLFILKQSYDGVFALRGRPLYLRGGGKGTLLFGKRSFSNERSCKIFWALWTYDLFSVLALHEFFPFCCPAHSLKIIAYVYKTFSIFTDIFSTQTRAKRFARPTASWMLSRPSTDHAGRLHQKAFSWSASSLWKASVNVTFTENGEPQDYWRTVLSPDHR